MDQVILNDEIYDRVKKIISSSLYVDENQIKPESNIITDLGASSLDLVSLLFEFETEFNHTIPDEDKDKLLIVKDIVEYIHKQKEQN